MNNNNKWGPLMLKVIDELSDGKPKTTRDLLIATNSLMGSLKPSLKRLIKLKAIRHEKITILADNDQPMPRNIYIKIKKRVPKSVHLTKSLE
ncbi:hypothetical protein [Shewanella surugensis]|uniref:MarR family transcriptional regulator n=1 Tax=Shewanella surugensis TaxID=212020 RepID=A0ABT0LBF6_9GAMM|nr:hypothetical protein [Shewanella surugensis]MCL1124830.1 hypothetical protein [Shewanella surugensis]